MADKKFHIKHIEIWILLFVAAVVVAVIFFVRGCQGMNEDYKPGYYIINPVEKKDIPYYAYDYTLQVYLDGSSKDIQNRRDEIADKYSNALSSIYAYLDESTTYNDYVSIGYINKHVNEIVTVSEATYKILEDAYQKTLSSTNYSIFAAPIYDFYDTQSYQDEDTIIRNDPMYNDYNKIMLASIATYITDRNNIDLAFFDNYQIKLSISDTYKAYLTDNEIDLYMSLNVLKRAYIMDYVLTQLDLAGVTNGAFASNYGTTIQLKNSNAVRPYYLYNIGKDEEDIPVIENVANVNVRSVPNSQVAFRRYKLNAREDENYIFNVDGVYHYRSQYVNISTGLEEEIVSSIIIYSFDYKIIDSAYLNNELVPLKSKEEILTYLTNHNKLSTLLAFNLFSEAKTTYILSSMKDYVSKIEGCNVVIIDA